MFRNTHIWLGSYIKQHLAGCFNKVDKNKTPISVLFTICDHYEPYWQNNDDTISYNRVKRWMDHYQPVAAAHRDCLGNSPKHCFFYPIEEYKKNLVEMVAEICRNGFGETEIHLHHHDDTSENLRKNLEDFKKKLWEVHGLLSKKPNNSEIRYGFIHGDWALDNSKPDGSCCGVNDEITVLQETGCYADFTMPSAPSDTQTRIINSIYYAIDDPEKPKSHDTGKAVIAGEGEQPGLMCIQGPLGFNLNHRKFGVLPRIENGYLSADIPITLNRVRIWINSRISVLGRPDIIFVKLYTHGTQEKIMEYFFYQGALNRLFHYLEGFCLENQYQLYYVSARQMFNVIKALEDDSHGKVEQLLNQGLELQY
jgi:hypothetical protein